MKNRYEINDIRISSASVELYRYLSGRRNIGHTKLMEEGTQRYDGKFLIIGANLEHAHSLALRNKNASTMSIQNLKSLMGQNVPVAIDNYTFTSIFENHVSNINELDSHIELLKTIAKDEQESSMYFEKITNLSLIEVEQISLWDRIFHFKKIIKEKQETTKKKNREKLKEIYNR